MSRLHLRVNAAVLTSNCSTPNTTYTQHHNSLLHACSKRAKLLQSCCRKALCLHITPTQSWSCCHFHICFQNWHNGRSMTDSVVRLQGCKAFRKSVNMAAETFTPCLGEPCPFCYGHLVPQHIQFGMLCCRSDLESNQIITH